MKNLSLLVFVLLLSVAITNGQTTHFSVENQNIILDNGTRILSTIDLYGTHSFTSKIGIFAWLIMDKEWAESYVGVSYSPWSWWHFSAGAGLETNDNPWRIGGIMLLTHKEGYGLLILEDGGSGNWWRGVVNYNVSKKIGLGVMTQKNIGTGLRAETNIPNTPIQIWIAILYNNKEGVVNAFCSFKFKL